VGRGIPCRLGSFRRDGPYLLPPLRVFDPTVSAISIKRRMASEREGLSFFCLAQFSIATRVRRSTLLLVPLS
jgi:hypothetical protein